MKDLSDANRAVNWLKQTEDVGLLIHAIPMVNLRTVSISGRVQGLRLQVDLYPLHLRFCRRAESRSRVMG